MKITHLLVFTVPLLMLGCKKETAPPASQPTTVANPLDPQLQKETTPPDSKPTTVFPGLTNAIRKGKQALTFSEWDKVKISDSGDIIVNEKQMSLADFSAECQRLKQAGGAALIYTGDMPHLLTPAQTEALQKLTVAGVPMKIAQKESEVD